MVKIVFVMFSLVSLFSCGKSKDDIRNEFVADSIRYCFIVSSLNDSILRQDTIKQYLIHGKNTYNKNVLTDSIIWSYDSIDSVTNVKCYNNGKLKTVDTYHRDSIGKLIKIIISDKVIYTDYELTYEYDTINNTKIEIIRNNSNRDFISKIVYKYDDSGIINSKMTIHPIYGALSKVNYKTKSGVIVSDVDENMLFKNNDPLNISKYTYDSDGNLKNIITTNLVWNTDKITKFEYVNKNCLIKKTITVNGDIEITNFYYYVRYFYKNKSGHIVKL